MRTWPADSIDLVVTSPPYWGLRDYGEETVRIWGGIPECEHEWNNYVFPKRGHTGDKSTLEGTQIAPLSKSIGGTTTNTCVKCGAWRGSLGLEPHPQMFIDHLVEICGEIKRVLKPSGTFWLNLGDSYYGSGGAGGDYNPGGLREGQPRYKQSSTARSNWLRPKQKLMIPARVAIALQHDGWLLRNDIIWQKPNAMPSSVKDRLSNAYEHVFLLVKNNDAIYWVDRFTGQLTASKPTQYYVHDETGLKRLDRPKREVDNGWFNENGTAKFKYAWQGHDYYFDLDAIRNPHSQPDALTKKAGSITRGGQPRQSPEASGYELKSNPKGKNPGNVWRIATTPFPGAHFATFPPKLIEPIIRAGSPRWICSKCGKPRERITEKSYYKYREGRVKQKIAEINKVSPTSIFRTDNYPIYETVGWSDCGCGEKWVGSVVLDPFGGSGTVGQVARKLGRRFILIEIIPEYCKMAEQRVRGKYKPIPEGVTPLTQSMEDENA